MNFYVLSSKNDDSFSNKQYKQNWCDAWAVNRVNGPYEKCPLCGRPVSMRKWEKPRVIRLTKGKLPDRLIQWLNEPLVISERFLTAFRKSELTGIKAFHEIEILNSQHMKEVNCYPVRYYWAELSFNQSVSVDLKTTVITGQRRDWSCAICNPFGMSCDRIEQFGLDTTHWNGIDIFRLYIGEIICSQRFKDFIDENDLTNFLLVPIEKYSASWTM